MYGVSISARAVPIIASDDCVIKVNGVFSRCSVLQQRLYRYAMLLPTFFEVVRLFDDSPERCICLLDISEQVLIYGLRKDVLELLHLAFDNGSVVPRHLARVVN